MPCASRLWNHNNLYYHNKVCGVAHPLHRFSGKERRSPKQQKTESLDLSYRQLEFLLQFAQLILVEHLP